MDIKMTGIVFQTTFSAQLCQQKPMIDDVLRYFLLREIVFTFLFLYFCIRSLCFIGSLIDLKCNHCLEKKMHYNSIPAFFFLGQFRSSMEYHFEPEKVDNVH